MAAVSILVLPQILWAQGGPVDSKETNQSLSSFPFDYDVEINLEPSANPGTLEVAVLITPPQGSENFDLEFSRPFSILAVIENKRLKKFKLPLRALSATQPKWTPKGDRLRFSIQIPIRRAIVAVPLKNPNERQVYYLNLFAKSGSEVISKLVKGYQEKTLDEKVLDLQALQLKSATESVIEEKLLEKAMETASQEEISVLPPRFSVSLGTGVFFQSVSSERTSGVLRSSRFSQFGVETVEVQLGVRAGSRSSFDLRHSRFGNPVQASDDSFSGNKDFVIARTSLDYKRWFEVSETALLQFTLGAESLSGKELLVPEFVDEKSSLSQLESFNGRAGLHLLSPVDRRWHWSLGFYASLVSSRAQTVELQSSCGWRFGPDKKWTVGGRLLSLWVLSRDQSRQTISATQAILFLGYSL